MLITRFDYLTIISTIILFKKTDDILQGISKLDYLLKVSVFQVFKNTLATENESSHDSEMDF